MENLKLIKILFISLLLWIFLIIPNFTVWVLTILESIFRILKETFETLIKKSKEEVYK